MIKPKLIKDELIKRRGEQVRDVGTVVVLSGGLSHEREVSIRSGRQVTEGLRAEGLDVVESDLDSELLDRLAGLPGAVVFPLLHGETGEDGALREVLRLLDVPFVGSDGTACRTAFDKSIATPVVAGAGISCPEQVALPHEIFRELGARALVAALGKRIGFPMMVKPSRSGSALGCTKVSTPEELPAAMVAAFAYGSVAVVESFIAGTEVTVAVIDRGEGPEALPAVEIRPDSGVYDYAARYTAGATRFLCPADLTEAASQRCAELALSVHQLLGLTDLSRTDLIVRPDGEPIFLEVSVAPGMTETSAVPLALDATGWGLGPTCAALARNAVRRHHTDARG